MTDFLFIPTEDGTEEKFEILYEFERHDTGKKYIIVVPADQDMEDGEQEVFAFRFQGESDQMTLEMIEDDQEWEVVEEMFETWLSEEFQEQTDDSVQK